MVKHERHSYTHSTPSKGCEWSTAKFNHTAYYKDPGVHRGVASQTMSRPPVCFKTAAPPTDWIPLYATPQGSATTSIIVQGVLPAS